MSDESNVADDASAPEAISQAEPKTDYVSIVANIVAAYVSNNNIRASDLPELIVSVHASITGIENGAKAEPETAKRAPAVSVKKSLGDDYLISLIDGKKYRTLRRHLGKHGMTPESYREEYGLPATYPMVAPSYSAKRSALAKEIGLGSSREAGPKPVKLVPKDGSRGRGRPRKDAA